MIRSSLEEGPMLRRAIVLTAVVVPSIVAAASCGGGGGGGTGGSGGHAAKDPGALIDATMKSKVGVVLDDLPMSMRDRVAQSLIAKPTDFWIARATAQAKLTTYRLV